MYKQGDEANYIFIVKSGEFELVKKLDLNVHLKTTYNNIGLPRNEIVSPTQKFEAKVAILATGEIFGDEEVLKHSLRQYTCRCHSISAVVMAISKTDFVTRIKADESVQYLMRRIMIKETSRNQIIKNIGKRNEESYSSRSSSPQRSSTPVPTMNDSMMAYNSPVNFNKIHRVNPILQKIAMVKPIGSLEIKRLQQESISNKPSFSLSPEARRTPSVSKFNLKSKPSFSQLPNLKNLMPHHNSSEIEP